MSYALANAPLLPLSQPLVLSDQRFCLQYETRLRVQEELGSFSHDDFKITNMDTGMTFFSVAGNVVSLSQQKTLYDNTNMPVWVFKHSLLPMKTRFHVYSSAGAKLFTIKNKHRWLPWQGTKMIVNLNHGVITLQAGMTDRIAVITYKPLNGVEQVIAKVQRPFYGGPQTYMGNVQEYNLSVAPGVDIAAMVAFVIALDEKGEKGQRTR